MLLSHNKELYIPFTGTRFFLIHKSKDKYISIIYKMHVSNNERNREMRLMSNQCV